MNAFHLVLFYAVVIFVAWITVQFPKYKGPSKVKKFNTESDFYENILKFD